MIEKILLEIGLSENEAKIYLALLQMKKASSSVIGNRVNLKRNMARYNCKSLEKQGLVNSNQEGNTIFYSAEPPERIIHLLEEKKNKITQQQFQANQFLGILQAMQNPSLMCPSVEYYEGREGIIAVYEDILETGEDHYCWTNLEKKREILGSYLDKHVKKRIEKKIKIYGIKAKNKKSIKNLKIKNLKREIRLVEKLPITNGEILIYKDKVAIISFNKTKPTGFVLKSDEVSKIFKGVFDGYWYLTQK